MTVMVWHCEARVVSDNQPWGNAGLSTSGSSAVSSPTVQVDTGLFVPSWRRISPSAKTSSAIHGVSPAASPGTRLRSHGRQGSVSTTKASV
ncbi:hypothetical protein ACNF49_39845 [Actinomadura sp. ATCC 39365]